MIQSYKNNQCQKINFSYLIRNLFLKLIASPMDTHLLKNKIIIQKEKIVLTIIKNKNRNRNRILYSLNLNY